MTFTRILRPVKRATGAAPPPATETEYHHRNCTGRQLQPDGSLGARSSEIARATREARGISAKQLSIVRTASLALVAAIITPVHGQTPRNNALVLIEKTLAAHPELNALTIHVTPPGSSENIIVASNFAPYGKKADADDLALISICRHEIVKKPDRYGIGMCLSNSKGQKIGSVNISFKYASGDEIEDFAQKAETIAAELAVQIPDEAFLVALPGEGSR